MKDYKYNSFMGKLAIVFLFSSVIAENPNNQTVSQLNTTYTINLFQKDQLDYEKDLPIDEITS